MLNGSREGLFFAAITAARHVGSRKGRPAILMPNPFYPAYGAGARAAGCEQVYLPTTRRQRIFARSRFARRRAAGAHRGVLHRLARQPARRGRHARIFCAAEAARRPFRLLHPQRRVLLGNLHQGSAGQRAGSAGPDFANVIVFQSLSKRSNLPGMRVGFAAGDRKFLAAFHELRNVAAPQVPVPLQHVAVAAYSDEAHVEENRKLYRIKFDLADQILGNRYGYRRPAGGFCVWLDVSDRGGDEATCVKLYRDAGVRVIPGSYLARCRTTAPIPARAISGLRWCRILKSRPRRCIGWSKLWINRKARSEHGSDRTSHPLVEPLAAIDPRCAGAAYSRTGRPRPDRAVRRRIGGADDLVGAGSEPQPRHLAPDPQHPRLSRRDQRRHDDADPRPRRDHADPAHRRVGLAHADPSHLRSRGAAARLLAAGAPCSPRALPAASSMAAPGRCRPASAAWSAMRWCARRRWCSAPPA